MEKPSISTYFTGGFEPEAGTVFSSKTKSGPEQSNDIGSGKAEHVNHISGLGTKNGSKEECNLVGKDPLQTTGQSNNSKNGYSTSRGTKNFKEDCIRFGGKEYIAIRENGDKRNQESRGFRGHKPEICDPQYLIRPSSSRAYYARMNRLDESLRCGEASMSAIAYNEANISGSTWMDNEQSYVLGDLYG